MLKLKQKVSSLALTFEAVSGRPGEGCVDGLGQADLKRNRSMGNEVFRDAFCFDRLGEP
jgi:hypothetical protein